MIGGALPDVEGLEKSSTAFSHPMDQVAKLAGVGILFAIGTILCMRAGNLISERDAVKQRFVAIGQNFFSTGFAWALFFAGKWGLSFTQVTHEQSLLRVALALLLSGLSFIWIFGLDKIADADKASGGSKSTEHALRTLVQALGILVGFSWEQAFDSAVDETAQVARNPAIAKLALSIVLVIIVFPAWRFYILPTVNKLEEEHEKKHHAEYKKSGTFMGLEEEAKHEKKGGDVAVSINAELDELRKDLWISTIERDLAIIHHQFNQAKSNKITPESSKITPEECEAHYEKLAG